MTHGTRFNHATGGFLSWGPPHFLLSTPKTYMGFPSCSRGSFWASLRDARVEVVFVAPGENGLQLKIQDLTRDWVASPCLEEKPNWS